MYVYLITEEEFCHEDVGNYVAYGLKVIFATYGVYSEILRISDISTDKNSVIKLADLCNRNQASPVHIFDVIQDWFT